MVTIVSIKDNYQKAKEAFNNELNDYFEKQVENDRPYFSDGAMLEYLSQLECAINNGTDLTWELGKKTRTGYVATFEPSEKWQETYLLINKSSPLIIDQTSKFCAYITMGDKVVYLDNSTGEQIVEIWDNVNE